jgi:hypothetical protein
MLLCKEHFHSAPFRLLSHEERVAVTGECTACQEARRAERERVQREDTIDPTQPYGQHISLTCVNHPELRWTTKNIDYIGARSIFYHGWKTAPECMCKIDSLIVVPVQPVEEGVH